MPVYKLILILLLHELYYIYVEIEPMYTSPTNKSLTYKQTKKGLTY